MSIILSGISSYQARRDDGLWPDKKISMQRAWCMSLYVHLCPSSYLESPYTILGYITYYDSITLKAAFCVLCTESCYPWIFKPNTKPNTNYLNHVAYPIHRHTGIVPRLWVAELVIREKCLSRYVCAMIDSLIDSMFDTRTSMRCIHSPEKFYCFVRILISPLITS